MLEDLISKINILDSVYQKLEHDFGEFVCAIRMVFSKYDKQEIDLLSMHSNYLKEIKIILILFKISLEINSNVSNLLYVSDEANLNRIFPKIPPMSY